MSALLALIRKDLVLYFSNRRALITTVGAPIVIAAFFGYLFDPGANKPARIPVALTMSDHSDIGGKIAAALKGDATLDVRETSEAEGIDLVRRGKVRAAMVFPDGFGSNAARAMFRPDAKPELTLHYDPSQAMALAVVRGMLAQHVMQTVSEAAFGPATLLDARARVMQNPQLDAARQHDLVALFDNIQRVQTQAGANGADTSAPVRFAMPFKATEHEVTSAERKYNSYAHSFAGMGVQFVLFMGIEFGVSVLLARRLGLWKRLRAAPVTRGLLLGSRIASGALTAAILLAVIFAAAMIFFRVRIAGSVIGFVGVGLAFALLTSTFGLLIASLGKTPEATRGLAIFATLIMVMLGGAWVPTFVFPEWLQTFSLIVPTRWAIDGLDAMSWRGLGLQAAMAPIGAMLAFSAVFGAIAIWRFDWEE